MSIKAIALVLDHYPVGGTEKLVVLALADWCNDDGESLHPSIERIAKRACVNVRSTQRVLSGLISDGLVEVIGNAIGGAPGATRDYRLRLDRIEEMRDTGVTGDTRERLVRKDRKPPRTGVAADIRGNPTGVTGDTGVADDVRRVSPMTETGVTGDTQSSIEPSIEPPEEKKAPAAPSPAPAQSASPKQERSEKPTDVPDQTWADFLAHRRAKKAPVTVTALAGIRREADKALLPMAEVLELMCQRGWTGFRAEWVRDQSQPHARPSNRPLSAAERGDMFMQTLRAGRAAGHPEVIDVEPSNGPFPAIPVSRDVGF